MTNEHRWTTGTLGSVIAQIRSGYSANGEDRRTVAHEVGVLKTGAVLGGQFNPLAHKAIVDGTEKLRIPVRKGTVLIGRKNSADMVGAAVYVDANYSHLFLSDLIWEVETGPGAAAEWLTYALQHDDTQARIRSSATGTQSTMKNLSRTSFLQIPLEVPPLPEQRKIAEILRTWDDAIDNCQLLMSFKRQTLAQSRVKLFAATHAGGAGEARLGDAFVERSETTSAALPLLSVTRLSGVVRQTTAGRKDNSSADRSRYKRVVRGDIAYNTMRMWQGASGVVPEEGIVSPAYTVVVPKADHIDLRYAAHLFKSKRMMFDFERYSQGLTSDTWNLKYPAFSEIMVSLPSLERQRRVADYLDEATSELALLDRQIELLRTQKRGLMQKLLTGDIRVNVDEGGDA